MTISETTSCPCDLSLHLYKGCCISPDIRSIVSKDQPRTKMISSRELPMPHVNKLSSLDQAHATLLHCWAKLSRFVQENTRSRPATWSPVSLVAERRNFQQWLERWELAFTAFLSNAMASMTSEDVTLSRILKCNHLACTVMAADSDPPMFEVFEAEFRAIIELAGAVLRARHLADSPQDTKSNTATSPVTGGLDVKEPLQVVISTCPQENMRTRASELLSSFYR